MVVAIRHHHLVSGAEPVCVAGDLTSGVVAPVFLLPISVGEAVDLVAIVRHVVAGVAAGIGDGLQEVLGVVRVGFNLAFRVLVADEAAIVVVDPVAVAAEFVAEAGDVVFVVVGDFDIIAAGVSDPVGSLTAVIADGCRGLSTRGRSARPYLLIILEAPYRSY